MQWIIYYGINDGEAEILRCIGDEPRLTLPQTLEGCPVTGLGRYCFAGNAPMEAMGASEPRLLRSEPPRAVPYYNKTLKQLTLPHTLKTLGERCFSNCQALRHVELPEGITQLPDYTFAECRSLLGVELPKMVQSLGRCCFYNCIRMERLNLPDTVRAIGDRMLMNCAAVTEFSFHAGINAGALLDDLSQQLRLQVRFADGEEIELLLPEYSYEYSELIPARQFRSVDYGSGGLYRSCFSDRDIDFALYDGYFYECKRDETVETAVELAYKRLRWHRELRSKAEEAYWSFLVCHPKELAELLIRNDDAEGLDFVLAAGSFSREQLVCMLEQTECAGNVRLTGRLLEATGQQGNFGADKCFDL